MGTENVKLGVCTVNFNGVDLGLTKGGVEVEVATETYEVMVDQFGNSPVNEYILARTVTVRIPLAESTLENLQRIMPGTTVVTSGAIPNTKSRADVTNGTGLNLLDYAEKLILHPKALPSSDKSEDFIVPLAATAGAISYAYKLDEERIFNVEFKGYPNSTTGLLFQIGDETA
jgi:hypothetical protein